MNALIHPIEVNDRHGVGILLKRIFGDGGDFVVVRSRTLHPDGNTFGAREEFLGDRFTSPRELRARLGALAAGGAIERILCVPYYSEDFRHAAMLKEITGAPLCTFVMDDQNIFTREVGDFAVQRLLDASDLRLGISPQLCLAYERKFGKPFAWLPPIVPEMRIVSGVGEGNGRAALIGNVWSARQLEDLRRVARESGLQIDWFGRGPDASWLNVDAAALAADGIHLAGFITDDDLSARLMAYTCAIVPSGRLDAADDKCSFARLSLPSRIVYLLTQARVPVLVLGSAETAAAAFVLECGCGLVSDYEAADVGAAMKQLEEMRAPFEAAAEKVARRLVLPDADQWIWKSLAAARPVDDRFEEMRTGRLAELPFEVPERRPALPRRPRNWWNNRFGRLEDAGWLRFSRKAHLPRIRRQTAIRATGPHSFEVSEYQRALAVALVRSGVRRGSRVLLLSGEREWLRALRKDYEIVDHGGDIAAVLSFNGDRAFARADLDALGARGALQVHCWTAYARPGHFHAPAPAMRLLDELDDLSRLEEEILADEDFLFMSPRAIEAFWKPADPAEVAASGRPFSLNLCWRTP